MPLYTRPTEPQYQTWQQHKMFHHQPLPHQPTTVPLKARQHLHDSEEQADSRLETMAFPLETRTTVAALQLPPL